MNFTEKDIIVTGDGSHSLRHPIIGELYHSDRGAIGEAMHVFIRNGFEFCIQNGVDEITIFEVGFGSGLNCWLTFCEAIKRGVKVNYHAIELYPIDVEVAKKLDFTTDETFLKLHTCTWDENCEISPYFSLTKHHAELENFDFSLLPVLNLVYFDAFAPDSQPQLWSSTIFKSIYDRMLQSGVLVTYTSKGIVKQNLRSVGFEVGRLQGALGKRHMIRAVKL